MTSSAARNTSIARFAPVEIGADPTALPESERRALVPLVTAARLMDALFLRQLWSGNDALLQELAVDAAAGGDPAALRCSLLNKGPWPRLDHNRPFVDGVPPKPGGANVYPLDARARSASTRLESAKPSHR